MEYLDSIKLGFFLIWKNRQQFMKSYFHIEFHRAPYWDHCFFYLLHYTTQSYNFQSRYKQPSNAAPAVVALNNRQ